MPKPTFDIREYELRGITPQVFTAQQQERLNKTLSRVHGQIDWTAQLLGFNGPNYWGLPNPKTDFSYNWTGLPETMNEKRQMQSGAFGVYNKNKDYDEWPAPFNRENVRASGDASFHIFEKEGVTLLSPLGQGEDINFSSNPYIFSGGSYVFDGEITVGGIEFSTNSVRTTYFYVGDQKWSRLDILENASDSILIGLKGSPSTGAPLNVLQWSDISDWKSQTVQDQFIGLWGNKGNSLSMDAAFDSLDLHSYDEKIALGFADKITGVTVEKLMALVGLEPTPYTKFAVENFEFSIGDNCPIASPLPPFAPEVFIDNGELEFLISDPPQDLVDNGDFDDTIPPTSGYDEGEYERIYSGDTDYLPQDYEFFYCDADCYYSMRITQTLGDSLPCGEAEAILYDNEFFDDPHTGAPLLDNGLIDATRPTSRVDEGTYERTAADTDACPDDPKYYKGVDEFLFEYKALAECGKIDFPCVEWVFDPSLDDGEYDRVASGTTGPWATANEGQYDRIIKCGDDSDQGLIKCDSPSWCGFDEGQFDKPVNEECFFDPLAELNGVACDVADGGVMTVSQFPDYEDCICLPESCCVVDNDQYVVGATPPAYVFPNVVDGGVDSTDCVSYDNDEFDRNPLIINCELDNGTIEGGPYAGTEDDGEYNQNPYYCDPCTDLDDSVVVPCALEPVRVNIKDTLFADVVYTMEPNLQNSLAPLRVWKNHVMTVTDTAPHDNSEYFNMLIADENRGPEPEDSYRSFVRLPLEYQRNGKEWNRAIAICNNQGYFSAPTSLSETEADPEIARPYLYAETYFRTDIEDGAIFYEEGYLVSTSREDSEPVQPDFEDSIVSFETPEPIPYAFAKLEEYDPFDLRVPYLDGEWRGRYFTYGIDNTLPSITFTSAFVSKAGISPTGFLEADILSGSLLEVNPPTFDESRIKRPNVEFPDSTDQASLKNYVVSYAYFVADFSASDDPVFDPDKTYCWRRTQIDCLENIDGECTPTCDKTNTAYRLHEYPEPVC